MAVVGSRIDVSVRSAARLNPLAGVTVAVSPQVFLTADMSGSPVSSVVSNGMGEVVCYALPGTYSFTASGAVAIPDQVVTDTLGGGLSVSDEGVLTALIDGKLAKASNLSDVADAPTARVNLGLGSAATQPSTAFDAAGAAAAAQAAAILAAAADATTKANNAQTVAEGYTDTSVAALVNSAPATLDTLKELADALGDDANYAATVTAALALKAPLDSPALTGIPTAPTAVPGTDTDQIASTAFVGAGIAVETSRAETEEALLTPKSGRVVCVADFGAVPDSGTTDNLAAFNAAAAAALAAGHGLYIPAASGSYDLSAPFVQPQGVAVRGDGFATHVRNVSGTSDATHGYCWYHGTYTTGTSGAYQETAIGTFSGALTGQRTLVLTATTGLAAGDVVGIDGPTPSGISANLPNEVNEVLAVAGTTVTLLYGLTDDYSTGTLRKLNAGGVTSVLGAAAFAQVKGALSDIRLSSVNGIQVLHVAAYRSLFRRVLLHGQQTIAGNPVARCLFDGVEMEYTKYGYQGAYYSHHNWFVVPRMLRVGEDDTSQAAFFVQALEGGKAHRIIEPDVEDSAATGSGNATVYLGPRSIIKGGRIGAHRPGVGAIFAPDSCTVDDVTVDALGSGDNPITLAGNGPIASRCRVRNTPSGKNGIRFGPSSVNGLATGNVLGVIGAFTTQDLISDSGTGNIKRDNIGYGYIPRVNNQGTASVITGTTTETTIQAQTFTAGAVQLGGGWRVTIIGNTAGTGGNKTIKVYLGTTVLCTLTVSGAVGWSIFGTITPRSGTSGWVFTFTTFNGATVGVTTGNNSDARTAIGSLSVTGTLANSGDTVTAKYVDFEPFAAGALV